MRVKKTNISVELDQTESHIFYLLLGEMNIDTSIEIAEHLPGIGGNDVDRITDNLYNLLSEHFDDG